MTTTENILAAQTLYAQGVEKRHRGELGAARNEFKKALDLNPDFAAAKTALDMLDDILQHGNRERYNV